MARRAGIISPGSCHEPGLKRWWQAGVRLGPTSPFSPNSWHESVLNIFLYKPFVQPTIELSVLPLSSPLCSSPKVELILQFAQNLSRFEGPPSIQVITKVRNFILSSLIARLALAMLYI